MKDGNKSTTSNNTKIKITNYSICNAKNVIINNGTSKQSKNVNVDLKSSYAALAKFTQSESTNEGFTESCNVTNPVNLITSTHKPSLSKNNYVSAKGKVSLANLNECKLLKVTEGITNRVNVMKLYEQSLTKKNREGPIPENTRNKKPLLSKDNSVRISTNFDRSTNLSPFERTKNDLLLHANKPTQTQISGVNNMGIYNELAKKLNTNKRNYTCTNSTEKIKSRKESPIASANLTKVKAYNKSFSNYDNLLSGSYSALNSHTNGVKNHTYKKQSRVTSAEGVKDKVKGKDTNHKASKKYSNVNINSRSVGNLELLKSRLEVTNHKSKTNDIALSGFGSGVNSGQLSASTSQNSSNLRIVSPHRIVASDIEGPEELHFFNVGICQNNKNFALKFEQDEGDFSN